VWDRRVIRKIVASDEYRPLTFEEIRELVTPEVAARLDPSKRYGVQWYNRDKATSRTVSEPDGNGGRRYRKRKTVQRRPREEWLAIPVPASDRLPRELVDQARATMEANKGAERKHLAREWELRGLVRCSCGRKMQTKTTNPPGYTYYYYVCSRRNEVGPMGSCRQRVLRAEEAEAEVWEFVSGALKDPERLRVGYERMIEDERKARRKDPKQEAQLWANATLSGASWKVCSYPPNATRP